MKLAIASLVFWLGGLIALADDAPEPMPAKEPQLRSELLDRTKTDQEARKAMMQWMKVHGSNGGVADRPAARRRKPSSRNSPPR